MAGRCEFGQWQQNRLRETSGRSIEAAEPLVLQSLQERLDQLLADVQRPVRILDAGCGKQLQIPIADNRHIIGIDIDSKQVARNSEVDDGIVGNIQIYPFESNSFDVIVCWNVLEHVEDPRAALANFERALRRPGILVLAGPHPRSFKGTATKLTPFWLHKLAWRRLLGAEPALERFPTHMSDGALPEQLIEFASERKMRVEFLMTYEGWEQRSFRSRPGIGGRAFRAGMHAVEAVTLGAVNGDVTDFIMVVSK